MDDKAYSHSSAVQYRVSFRKESRRTKPGVRGPIVQDVLGGLADWVDHFTAALAKKLGFSYKISIQRSQ